MKVEKRKFGVLSNGKKVHIFTVRNRDMSFSVTDYGCTITSIIVPSKNGKSSDIALGHSTIDGYINDHNSYFGALVGRYANRIANGSFSLNGKSFELDKNDNGNTLHGGKYGYDRMMWKASKVVTDEGVGVSFFRLSPSGEQGFPGNVSIKVTYLLTKENEIIMQYEAQSDRDTPINLTNHSYFNLKGEFSGNILDHEILINSNSYLEVDDKLIPTGNKIDVTGTAFDFRQPKSIGKDIEKTGNGYDHCFLINPDDKALPLCATVYEPDTGRKMEVFTNQPGVQFYTGNSVGGIIGKNGIVHDKWDGFCLETQQLPDAPNKPDFPNCILHPGEMLNNVTIYKFSW